MKVQLISLLVLCAPMFAYANGDYNCGDRAADTLSDYGGQEFNFSRNTNDGWQANYTCPSDGKCKVKAPGLGDSANTGKYPESMTIVKDGKDYLVTFAENGKDVPEKCAKTRDSGD